MLASPIEFDRLVFPVFASPKLDGVRALRMSSCFLSRTLKPLPNQHLQARFTLPDGLDGEVIVGDPRASDCYLKTVSTIMSENVTSAGVKYYIFDNFNEPLLAYDQRRPLVINHPDCVILEQFHVNTLVGLLELEKQMLSEGYEGLIVRDVHGRYKFGRSTAREGIMLKLKRFNDAEAIVQGFVEHMHNANEAQEDERGFTKRSSHQENQIPTGKLGALLVEWQGVHFNIGTGFTDADRQRIWNCQELYLGKFCRFKYLNVGMKEAPRHPVFLGWRNPIDFPAIPEANSEEVQSLNDSLNDF